MSRLLFLVTTLALFVHKGKAADCSGTAYPKTCELWSALQDNFGGASWTQCGSNAVNSRYVNPCGNAKCPVQNGLLTCNGNNEITSFNFDSENNLVAEADISSFVSMLETYKASYNFQTLTLQNQASLGLDECLEPCADGLTCDFTGSECTGSCTTDGICVTDAPTPAPSAPTPAPTSAPTYNTACSGTAYPKTCELWSALQDNFGGASWTQCGSNAVNSRYVNPCGNAKCPVQNGLLTCNGNNEITSFNFDSENNLVAEADISSFVSMLETYKASYNFQTLTLQNQASLGLDECLEPCADGLTCDFTGSECISSCTTDGICVTDAPTPAPTSAPTRNADCSTTANPKACELWSALQDNFGGASWTQCGSNAVNSRYVNPCGNAKCPVQNGLLTCNGNNEITSFNFDSENNLVAEADISSFVSMLETYKASYNFQTLTLQNQASLGLDECLEPCADGITCDFTGSECISSCTTDGICVTDAPTPAPTSAPTRKADCSTTANPKACELWSALQDNFGGASWTQCGSNAVNSRYINPCSSAKCPVQNGLVTCNSNNEITSFNFNSENNLIAEADISSFVSMLETYRDSYNFQTLTLQNQASLGLDECLEPCADGITCDFTGSECTGSCTTDGICVTDAPTPAPTFSPTSKAACSGTTNPQACKLWVALQDNFGGARWTRCGITTNNARYINPCGSAKCPLQNGLVMCNSKGEVTSFNFDSENNLVAEADISSFVSMLETYRDSYNFQTLTLQNQASLGLDECLEPCADGLTCDFTGSECTGSCTTDGICVTDAPTPAPTPLRTARPAKKPKESVRCGRFNTRFVRQKCNLWNSLMDAFTSDDWKVCQSSRNEDPCSAGACAQQEGFVGWICMYWCMHKRWTMCTLT